MNKSIQHRLDRLVDRFDEVAALLSEPEIQNNQNKFRTLSQEYAQIAPIANCYQQFSATLEAIEATKELISDPDPELRDMAKEELHDAKELASQLTHQLQILLLPKDPLH